MKRYKMIKNIIFFGAGKRGKNLLSLWESYGKQPEYFCDNNYEVQGRYIDGVKVISPDEIAEKNINMVFVSAAYEDDIIEQLHGLGIGNDKIFAPRFCMSEVRFDCPQNIRAMSQYLFLDYAISNREKEKVCMIDLTCGMVLGGVEQWSYQLADILKKRGYKGYFVTPDDTEKIVDCNTYPTIRLDYDEKNRSKRIFDSAMRTLTDFDNLVVICNFPFEIFHAACTIKKVTNKRIKIVAIIHSDEGIYYQTYTEWANEIDIILAISNKIYKTIIGNNVPKEKVFMLDWNMRFPSMIHKYSSLRDPIKIGYAGRIVIEQKRVDLIVSLARRLEGKNIDYVIEIAGTGDYENEFRNVIKRENLENKVKVLGLIPHKDIFAFWNKQDIYVMTQPE